MANGQGNIFAQALDRSTPGFDSLLNVIQQESSRIERNRQLAQQRKMEEDLLEFKADIETDVFQKTTAIENQKDRNLQRELAGIQAVRDANQAKAAAVQEQEDLLGEAKKEKRQQTRQQWKERYDTKGGPLLSGFEIPRVKEVKALGNDPNDLNAMYVLEDGQEMTPNEYEQNFSWALEAQPLLEEFQSANSNDDLYMGTVEKQVEGTLTNAVGETITVNDLVPTREQDGEGEEEIKTQVTKTYVGRDQAAQDMDQIRKGNKKLLEKYKTGQRDFNTIGQGEHDIIRNVRSDYEELRATFNEMSPDKYGEGASTVTGQIGAVGGATAGMKMGSPAGIWGAATGGVLGGLFGFFAGGQAGGLPYFDISTGKPLQSVPVSEMEENILDDLGEDSDIYKRFKRMRMEYSKLDNAKRDLSNLYLNPNFDRNTPVIDLFLSKDEFDEAQKTWSVPTKQNDTGNAAEQIRKKQSSSFMNQIITQPEDSTRKTPPTKFQ